jgi:hypothetical protein
MWVLLLEVDGRPPYFEDRGWIWGGMGRNGVSGWKEGADILDVGVTGRCPREVSGWYKTGQLIKRSQELGVRSEELGVERAESGFTSRSPCGSAPLIGRVFGAADRKHVTQRREGAKKAQRRSDRRCGHGGCRVCQRIAVRLIGWLDEDLVLVLNLLGGLVEEKVNVPLASVRTRRGGAG